MPHLTLSRFYGQERMYSLYSQKKRENKVSQKVFTQICSDFNKEIGRAVVEDGFRFFVPYGMGVIRVIKTNKFGEERFHPDGSIFFPKQSINWPLTEKLHKKVYLENEHTGGYSYLIAWFRSGRSFKYSSVYKFKAHYALRKKLQSILLDPNRTIDYPNDMMERVGYRKTNKE